MNQHLTMLVLSFEILLPFALPKNNRTENYGGAEWMYN